MKKYSAFKIPFLSFFSKGLYRDLCFNRKGTGIGYLFLLVMVISIPPVVQVHFAFSKFCREEAPQIISQLPQISFVHGEAVVDAPQPCVIKDPTTHKTLVIIDTTGKVTSLAGTDAVVLITRKEAIIRKNEVQSQSYNFTNFDSFVLTQDKLKGWLEIARKFLALALYPVMVIGLFFYRGTELLVYSVIAMLIASWLKLQQPYAPVLRLTSAAMTPSIIIGAVFDTAGVHLPAEGLVFFLLTVGYLYFGIRECTRDFRIEDAQDSAPAPADTPQDSEHSKKDGWF